MLTPSQVAQFRQKGFLNGGPVLSEAEVETLRFELMRVLENRDKGGKQPVCCHNLTGKDDAPVWQIVNIWEASDPFKALIHNPKITAMAAQLMPEATSLRMWHDQIQYKPAQKGGVNMWHQDSPYWPTLRPKDAQITAWAALDDVDADNGCMSMVPGTNLWGNQIEFLHTIKDFFAMPKEFQGKELKVELCPVVKGGVHFHHSLTWHGSQANTSGRPRRAIALHYMTQNTVYDEAGPFHPMKPFVTVQDGQQLDGEHFPICWKK